MNGLPWTAIFRLGLVQMSLGSIFVLMTSVVNRIIAVELALPALLTGGLLAIHYLMQMMRPHFGHGSDTGGRRTPWIIGGMLVLAIGGTLAAAATWLLSINTMAGIALAIIAFVLIGAGVGAGGTSLLVLIAAKVAPERRAAAACITWVMMIAGFIVTTVIAGQLLEPFTMQRMFMLVAGICVGAFLLATLSVGHIERDYPNAMDAQSRAEDDVPFMQALTAVMRERDTRLFAVFVTISMFAYGAQDLVLEPFAGAVFGMSVGESTSLSAVHHQGVLVGMLAIGALGSRWLSALRHGAVFGCLASAVCLAGLVASAARAEWWPLQLNILSMGLANGIFAVAAIGSMMNLVNQGARGRQGVRMGVWGAAQAIAMGAGTIMGTAMVDLTRALSHDLQFAYTTVFGIQAFLFIVAGLLATRIQTPAPQRESVASLSVAKS
ncbi:MAG: BCD family MFS transporter [Pseudomonadota bacterium]